MLTRLLLLSAVLAVSLSARDLKVVSNPKADFASYKTYTWLPPRLATSAGIQENDPVVAPLIVKAVNEQLAKKGLKEVPSGGDLQISAAGVSTGMFQVEGWLVQWGLDAYWGYSTPMVSTVSRYNKEGTLAVALIDAKTKKGVWAAVETEALGKESMIEGAVNKAASKMFSKYPPKQKK
jgi:hypothetical protein